MILFSYHIVITVLLRELELSFGVAGDDFRILYIEVMF